MTDANSSRVLLAAAVVWIGFAFGYPLFWRQPSPNLGSLRADQRGGILKLPDEGPLSLIVAKGSVVTLAIERVKPAAAQGAPGTAPAVQVQGPATPLPSAYRPDSRCSGDGHDVPVGLASAIELLRGRRRLGEADRNGDGSRPSLGLAPETVGPVWGAALTRPDPFSRTLTEVKVDARGSTLYPGAAVRGRNR